VYDFDPNNQLARSMEEIDDLLRQDSRGRLVGAVSATLVSSGLSIGYVVWLLRGGLLLSGLLAQLPAWRAVDPLMVLDMNDKRGGNGDGESLETIIDNNEQTEPRDEEDDARKTTSLRRTSSPPPR
jgi:hypothetical protein